MISLESPTFRPSIRTTGKVLCSPLVSHRATAMWAPGIGARRSCSIRLWSSAQRTFSL